MHRYFAKRYSVRCWYRCTALNSGQVKVTAVQVNLRISMPCLASNVLEPMLHPDVYTLLVKGITQPCLELSLWYASMIHKQFC